MCKLFGILHIIYKQTIDTLVFVLSLSLVLPLCATAAVDISCRWVLSHMQLLATATTTDSNYAYTSHNFSIVIICQRVPSSSHIESGCSVDGEVCSGVATTGCIP